MAAGSQGCRPNWADFPVAATINPINGRVKSVSVCRVKIC